MNRRGETYVQTISTGDILRLKSRQTIRVDLIYQNITTQTPVLEYTIIKYRRTYGRFAILKTGLIEGNTLHFLTDPVDGRPVTLLYSDNPIPVLGSAGVDRFKSVSPYLTKKVTV